MQHWLIHLYKVSSQVVAKAKYNPKLYWEGLWELFQATRFLYQNYLSMAFGI